MKRGCPPSGALAAPGPPRTHRRPRAAAHNRCNSPHKEKKEMRNAGGAGGALKSTGKGLSTATRAAGAQPPRAVGPAAARPPPSRTHRGRGARGISRPAARGLAPSPDAPAPDTGTRWADRVRAGICAAAGAGVVMGLLRPPPAPGTRGTSAQRARCRHGAIIGHGKTVTDPKRPPDRGNVTGGGAGAGGCAGGGGGGPPCPWSSCGCQAPRPARAAALGQLRCSRASIANLRRKDLKDSFESLVSSASVDPTVRSAAAAVQGNHVLGSNITNFNELIIILNRADR